MELHACGTSASTEAAAGAGLAVPLVTLRTVQRPGGSENGTEKGENPPTSPEFLRKIDENQQKNR